MKAMKNWLHSKEIEITLIGEVNEIEDDEESSCYCTSQFKVVENEDVCGARKYA